MSVPSVTIGLPVFNGERYIREAIDSVLNQTYEDFELIISDNCSGDMTESICRDYVRKDPRVQYIRNSQNIGAGPNFNSLVAHARGQYFKWLACDDVICPSFLAVCIRALENDASAALTCPRVRIIDDEGSPVEDYVSPFRTADTQRTVRFAEMLKGGHHCFEIFGLVRLSHLRSTHLIGNYNNGDGVLLANIALQGRVVDIPEYLLLLRRHSKSSMQMFGVTEPNASPDSEGYANWFDPRNRIGLSRSLIRAFCDYLWMIWHTPMPISQRWTCHRIVLKWLRHRWRGIAGECKRSIYHVLGFSRATSAGD